MRRALTASTFFLLFAFAFCHDFSTTLRPVRGAQQLAPAAAGIQLQPVLISGITSPIFAGNAGDGTNRLFIIEQGGVIKVLQPGSSSPTVFLDITTKVMSGGEQGLLGLAFHPLYESNGRFFVDYTRKPDGATVIAEYHVSAGNPNVADNTEIVHLTIPQPFANHNGGMLAFGPDAFLYIAMGDGGSGNDPGNRAQNINELLGKILRIDIDHPNGMIPYSSPSSNPFFGATPGADEIFAVGMRNPWRFSFDRGTGNLYVGDVGQSAWEEVDIVTVGGNYGWRVFEGNHCTGNDPGLCNPANYVPPVTEYAHAAGRCSITGGYVYRGTLGTLPAGVYLFADFCTGEIFMIDSGVQSLLLDTQLNISSFGEDESGELYVVGLGGQLYRIVAAAPPPQCNSSLSPLSQNFNSNAGSGTVSVSAAAGCAWTAVSNVPWVTVTSGASGTGIGTVAYSVASNKSSSIPRSGTITIAGLTFTVNQASFPASCTYSISPSSQAFNAAGGSGSFLVSTSGNCSWNAVSSAPWIVITSPSSGSDKSTLRFTVAANTG
ncbi:MAG TPA: PQQ-dependent sugar dehydrogenase, partial [Blastocatellia bacterium]|nr:PQQ-dependent sugar dehydrogenase [Blastocatellia bacterium]